MNRISFCAFRIFSWLLAGLPLDFLYFLSGSIAPLLNHLLRYRQKVIMKNLKRAFPENPPEKNKAIARKFYRHLSDLFVENIKLIRWNLPRLEKHISFSNPEVLDQLYQQGRNVVAVIAHYGNWEWLLGLSGKVRHHSIAMYKPLNNQYFDRYMVRLRSKFGTDIIPMRKTLPVLLEHNRTKRSTLSCFIADQSPVWEEVQHWTPFLNQETPVYLGIEKIARKINAAVVFLHNQKIGRGQYRVDIIPLITEPRETKEHEITLAHVQYLEKIIREKPEFWLWSHRRWKLTDKKKRLEQQIDLNSQSA